MSTNGGKPVRFKIGNCRPGQLEGEITSSDFLGAVKTTPPSIAPGSLRRFESWNAEFGCELRAPPVREEVVEAPAAAPPEAEAPPNDLD